ncbi:Protein extra-macrochaetae, partial [Stegodyphus mimosarum]
MPVIARRSKHKMMKSKRTRTEKDVTHDEIQALLAKLKEIVPNMPRNRKLSKLEIIQYVIDYIVDLQITLESHPVSHPLMKPRINSPAPRQPLGVIASPSNSVANTCTGQEVSQIEKVLVQQADPSLSPSRPVSC